MNRSIFLLFAVSLTAAGCSKSDMATVRGTVVVDGVPAESGYVSFFAVDGRAPVVGARISDGRYTAEVKPGLCNVQVRVPKVVGMKKLYETADSPVHQVSAESLPAKYNDATELQFDVQSGTNENNYELFTK